MEKRNEEALFAALMAQAARDMGKDDLIENRRLQEDPSAAVSQSVQREDLRFLQAQLRRPQKTVKKTVRRILLAAVITMALLISAVATFEDSLGENWASILAYSGSPDNYGYTKTQEANLAGPFLYIHHVPRGFFLQEKTGPALPISYRYHNAEGGSLQIILSEAEPYVDTEDAVTEDLELNGRSVRSVQKGDLTTWVWPVTNRNQFVTICTDCLDAEELEIVLAGISFRK